MLPAKEQDRVLAYLNAVSTSHELASPWHPLDLDGIIKSMRAEPYKLSDESILTLLSQDKQRIREYVGERISIPIAVVVAK